MLVWSKSLIEEQSRAKDLQVGLAGFGEQQIIGVLESIADTSGKYMEQISHFSGRGDEGRGGNNKEEVHGE